MASTNFPYRNDLSVVMEAATALSIINRKETRTKRKRRNVRALRQNQVKSRMSTMMTTKVPRPMYMKDSLQELEIRQCRS